MFSGIWRFCVFAVVLTAIAACKNVVEQPLVGSVDSRDNPGISGKWTSVDMGEAISVELKAQAENDDWFDFVFEENNNVLEGELRVGYFGDRLIFNVNVDSLVSEGTKMFDTSAPRYLLFGADILKGRLVIIPAKMDVFEARFAEYIDSGPGLLTDRCASSEEEDTSEDVSCNVLLSSSKVLVLTETPAFQRALLSNFDDVFPMEDVLILESKN